MSCEANGRQCRKENRKQMNEQFSFIKIGVLGNSVVDFLSGNIKI